MDVTAGAQGRRLYLSQFLTRRAEQSAGGRLPATAGPDDLLAVARELARSAPELPRAIAVSLQPSYPGVTAGPVAVGDRCRLVFACCLLEPDGELAGVVFTTLISGRLPQVSVAPPAAPYPQHWRPLQS